MDNQRTSRVTYDMPQEQLDYFDTRAKSSQSTPPSTSARVASGKRELPNSREAVQRVPRQVPQSRHDEEDNEPKLSVQKGTLSDHYNQYFAGPPRDTDAAYTSHTQSAEASVRSQKPVSHEQPMQANYPAQKPVILQVRQNSVPSSVRSAEQNQGERPRYQASANRQKSEDANADGKSQSEAQDDVFYWSHNSPSATSQRSVTNEPREPTIPSHSATQENRRRVAPEEELPPTPQNDYAQPQGDRQAPMRKSSIPRGTPMSRDSRSFRSESAASADDSQPPQRLQQAYIPRHADAIPPVRQPAAQQPQQSQPQPQPRQRQQHVEPQDAQQQYPVSKQTEENVNELQDEEENCTFQPHISNSTQRRDNNYQDSPHRSSHGTNPPRESRGDYDQAPFDKLHGDAETARRAGNSRRMQRKADEAELEINEIYGPRSTAVNPRRSAVERDPNQEQVFARLYADAQRYNREKSEQERLLEEKRQEERGEAPYDWSKGKDPKTDKAEEIAMSGDEKPASQPRRSPSRQKAMKNMEVFVRLARPNSITLSFQKQKELEEQEKQVKQQREVEQKRTDMEKIAGYDWGVPAKSFTFADLVSQNAMYVS